MQHCVADAVARRRPRGPRQGQRGDPRRRAPPAILKERDPPCPTTVLPVDAHRGPRRRQAGRPRPSPSSWPAASAGPSSAAAGPQPPVPTTRTTCTWVPAMATDSPSRGTAEPRPPRAADRRHDVRVVRRPGREAPQPLDGVTASVNFATERAAHHLRPRAGLAHRPGRGRRGRRLRRHPARAAGRARPTSGRRRRGDERPHDEHDHGSAGTDRLVVSRPAGPARGAAGDGPGPAVPQLAVARRCVLAAPVVIWGALAVPPGRLGQPPPRRGHDGHAGLARRRWPRSAGRCGRCSSATPAMPGMTMSLPRCTPERGDAADELYLEVAAAVTVFMLAGRYLEARAKRRAGRRAAGAARAGRQGRRRAATTTARSARPRRRAARRRPVRRPPGREGRHRRRRRRGRARPSTRRCSPARACRSRSAPATPSSAPRSTPAAAWSCGPPGSAPTPRWPRWPGWSSRPRPARPPCSGWPTASPAVFVPVVLVLAAATLGFWLARRRPAADARSPPRWPC